MLIPSGTSHCSSAMAKAAPRTVLITGCSSGIGLHMAVQLAQDPRKRFHVIATMRDLRKKDKLEAAAGDTLNKTLSIQHLDVCSDELVTECINSLPEKRLDVLGVPFNDVYAASKFAMEGFCESLAVQLLKFNIFISLVEPGPVNTEFETKLMEEVTQSEFPGADAATVHYFKEIYLSASHEIFTTMGQTPESVAKIIAYCVNSTLLKGRHHNPTLPVLKWFHLHTQNETGPGSVQQPHIYLAN
ncbi:retinol dehydrogenase 8 isoform X5 [Rhineura floridana]|uniref:retinol dehydrogenase 8 isoform X5 n=1 Tax=Rhineura floridana TaxID=261503 RepID=UPI002AC85D47|nr:retinol dehydrogenase 8 isoform X5 [Rhineura floridana]